MDRCQEAKVLRGSISTSLTGSPVTMSNCLSWPCACAQGPLADAQVHVGAGALITEAQVHDRAAGVVKTMSIS